MSYFVLLAESDGAGLLDKILDPRISPDFHPDCGDRWRNWRRRATAAIIRHRQRMVRIL